MDLMSDSPRPESVLIGAQRERVCVPWVLVALAASESWGASLPAPGRARTLVAAEIGRQIGDAGGERARLIENAGTHRNEASSWKARFAAAESYHATARGLPRTVGIASPGVFVVDHDTFRERGLDYWNNNAVVFEWWERLASEEPRRRDLVRFQPPGGARLDWPDMGNTREGPVRMNEWLAARMNRFADDREPFHPSALSAALCDAEGYLDGVAIERARAELRASVAAVLVNLERAVGIARLSGMGQGAAEFVDVEVGKQPGRADRLRTNRAAVVAAAVELIHRGEAENWVQAHELLSEEVRAVHPDGALPYRTAQNLRQAASRSYNVTLEEAKADGMRALGPTAEADAWS